MTMRKKKPLTDEALTEREEVLERAWQRYREAQRKLELDQQEFYLVRDKYERSKLSLERKVQVADAVLLIAQEIAMTVRLGRFSDPVKVACYGCQEKGLQKGDSQVGVPVSNMPESDGAEKKDS